MQVYGRLNVDNPTNGDSGVLAFPVDDVLSKINAPWDGKNITTPMYFIIAPSSSQQTLKQATFELIRKSCVVPVLPAQILTHHVISTETG